MRGFWALLVGCCLGCGSAGGDTASGAGSSSGADTSSSSASAGPISGPTAGPRGGPYFFARTSNVASEYGWLVDGNGTKTLLEGIHGELPTLIGYDEKLWVRSIERVDDGSSYTLWRQPIVDGVLQAAVPDLFPELVELSFDGRYALSAAEGLRLYEVGSVAPTTVYDGELWSGGAWSNSTLDFTFEARTSDSSFDLYFVEVADGSPSAPRRLLADLRRGSDACFRSPDGGAIACYVTTGEDAAALAKKVVLLDRTRDFSRREIEVADPTVSSSYSWFTGDGKYFVTWADPPGVIIAESIAGDERHVVIEAPGVRADSHPSTNWLGLSLPNGTTELAILDASGPRRIALGEGERVYFRDTTEYLFVADLQGVHDVRVLTPSGSGVVTQYEAEPETLTFFTNDLRHGVVWTGSTMQSLVLASGTPEPLGINEYCTPIVYANDYLMLEEHYEESGSRFHLVSWPGEEPRVVSVEFEEEAVQLSGTIGYAQAGHF